MLIRARIMFAAGMLSTTFLHAEIVGGKSISITEAPWQMLYTMRSFCGASWLGGRWVVTAAHCVEGETAATSFVHAGITRKSDAKTTNRIAVKRIIPYASEWINPWRDIALMELAADITAPLAKPIRYATSADVTAGLEKVGYACMASGWGGINRDGRFPDSLHAVNSKIHSTEKGVIYWAGQGGTAQVGSCPGDSGGPLVVKDAQGNWVLVGISSFIFSYCGDPSKPSGYARVSDFSAWIRQTTGISTVGLVAADGSLSPQGNRIRLDKPRQLTVNWLDLSGAVISSDRRLYLAGEHAFSPPFRAAGKYFLRVEGLGSGR